MKFLSFFYPLMCILLLIPINVQGQKNSKDSYTGNYTDPNSWQDGIAPATSNIGGQDFNIYGYITRSGDLDFANAQDSYKFTIKDTLVVNGNFTMGNMSMKLVIESGGILIIYGNFTSQNQISVANGGIFVVTGTMTFNGGNNQADYTGDGDLFAFNGITGTHPPSNATDSAKTGSELQEEYPDIYQFIIDKAPEGALPVVLYGFTARLDNKKINLSWSTLSEQNFDYFSIERSHDAKNYVQIGTVKGSGWSQTRNDYSFTDHNPMPGINYYRLKSVDFDGYTEIFPAISVFNDNVQVSVTSPVKDKTMTIHSNFEGKAQLVNLFGTSVMVGDVVVGPNEISLPQSLTRGIYLLAVTNDRQLVKKTKIYVE
jgi:hypothetical protein